VSTDGAAAFVSPSSLRQAGVPAPAVQTPCVARHVSAQPRRGPKTLVSAIAMAGLLTGTRRWRRDSKRKKRSATVCLFAPAPHALPSTNANVAEGASRREGLRQALPAALAAAAAALGSNPALAEEATKLLEAIADEEEASAPNTDVFMAVVKLNGSFIANLDSFLEDSVGLGNSFGYAIILYTCVLKIFLFPVTQGSSRSTVIMKLIQPKIDQLNKKYANDKETLNRQMLRLYDDAGVNPLGGCLPILFQLPVFITLYRSIQELASSNVKFREPFLWIPSLGGPMEAGSTGLDWLTKSKFQDHYEPLIGWDQAAAYLVLPVLLVASQYYTVATSSATSKVEGPAAAVTYILPLFIGYTGLSVPQGIGIYWLVNNVTTNIQQGIIQSQLIQEFPEYRWVIEGKSKPEVPKTEAESQAETLQDPFEKGSGFGSASASSLVEEKERKVKVPAVADGEETKKRKAKRLASKRRRK